MAFLNGCQLLISWLAFAYVMGPVLAPTDFDGGYVCSAPNDCGTRRLLITKHGNSIVRDGREWIPKGVTIVGRVAPAGFTRGPYLDARREFGASELSAAKRVFRADTVRFQISEPGLDEQSPIFSTVYRDEVAKAIRLARD